jgi:hypothetical protein
MPPSVFGHLQPHIPHRIAGLWKSIADKVKIPDWEFFRIDWRMSTNQLENISAVTDRFVSHCTSHIFSRQFSSTFLLFLATLRIGQKRYENCAIGERAGPKQEYV